jgi:hypothetical protein
MITKQEFEERIAQAIEEGLCPAQDQEGSLRCKMRAENGTRCILGVFIPDSVYTPEMEYATFSELSQELKKSIRVKGMTDDNMDMIQCLHDDCADVETFRKKFFTKLHALPFWKETR